MPALPLSEKGQILESLFRERILVFDGADRLGAVWGSQGSEPGQFLDPTGIATDGNGNVYVADIGNGRVQTFRLLPPLAPADGTPPA